MDSVAHSNPQPRPQRRHGWRRLGCRARGLWFRRSDPASLGWFACLLRRAFQVGQAVEVVHQARWIGEIYRAGLRHECACARPVLQLDGRVRAQDKGLQAFGGVSGSSEASR